MRGARGAAGAIQEGCPEEAGLALSLTKLLLGLCSGRLNRWVVCAHLCGGHTCSLPVDRR